jgi:hypothetical protein
MFIDDTAMCEINGSLMNMFINEPFINEHVHQNWFVNEHVRRNRFINEHAKYNFSSPQFHRQLASAEAFRRACRLLLV